MFLFGHPQPLDSIASWQLACVINIPSVSVKRKPIDKHVVRCRRNVFDGMSSLCRIFQYTTHI